MTVKGLTTPNRVGCEELSFCVGTRDLCVVSYWIDTLLLKNWGKYLRYFVASSSPLRGNPTQCSRGSKKNFWRRFRGGSRKQVNHTKYPSQSLSLALHYLPFTSRFPLPHFTLAVLFALSFPFSSSLSRLPFLARLFARVLVCLLVIMTSLISSPISPENEVLNFKQREGENLKDAWYRICNAQNRSTRKQSTSVLLRNT